MLIRFDCYLFSVSFMMIFPRVEKTMKDILSMGLQTHSCYKWILAKYRKRNIQKHEWLILLVPDKLLCQLLHKRVNFYPLILYASRSEKQQKNNLIRKSVLLPWMTNYNQPQPKLFYWIKCSITEKHVHVQFLFTVVLTEIKKKEETFKDTDTADSVNLVVSKNCSTTTADMHLIKYSWSPEDEPYWCFLWCYLLTLGVLGKLLDGSSPNVYD